MTHSDMSHLSAADLNFEVAQSKKCLSDHGTKSTIFATPHGDEWNNATIINEISKYYNLADNGFAPLMFLHKSTGFALPREGKPPSEINVSDFVLENIILGVKSIPSVSLSSKGTTLNDFVNQQILSYKQGFTDFQIIKSNTTSIDNNPTYQIQYTNKDGRATFDTLQLWTINGNRIYTILFNADPADYPTYLPIIQKMADSFVIFNNNNDSHNQMKVGNV
jgi:hypothetical protein